MRTTLTIHDDLYRQVRQIAAAQGSSVGSVIEEAITLLIARHRMATESTEEAFPDLPQFSGGGVQPGVDIDSNAALSELLDDGVPIYALR